MKKIDLTGKVFGELTVLPEDGRSAGGQIMWRCQRSCGKQTTAFSHGLLLEKALDRESRSGKSVQKVGA